MTKKSKKFGILPIRNCWLFAINSPADLARRLSIGTFQISPTELAALALDEGNYKLFSVNKEGKERQVQEPKSKLQFIHLRVHKLLARVQVPEYLHSVVRGRSYLSNARMHKSNVPVVKVDVKKFFNSVPRLKVYNFFRDVLQCRSDVAGLLANLLTFDRHLATGSCASPIISYYAFKSMFDEIEILAAVRGLTMTCYVDDITISGQGATKAVLSEVRSIISKHGLKSHKVKVFGADEPKIVTGICLTRDGARVPNKLHLKIKNGFDHLKEQSNDKKNLKSLLGRLEAAGQIDPAFRARATTLRNRQRPV